VGEGFGWTPQIGSVDTWIVQCDTLGIMENKLRLGDMQLEIPQFIAINNITNKPIIGLASGGSAIITGFE